MDGPALPPDSLSTAAAPASPTTPATPNAVNISPPTTTSPGAQSIFARARCDPFVIISFTYLIFTITDGGVRTIVLFNAFQRDFTAFQVSLMFVSYELAGVFTNFLAGVAGARWGLRATLLSGLALQLAGVAMLFGWRPSFSKPAAIAFVTAAQTLSGVAKDLVKLSGKAVTKIVTPEGRDGRLFKLVSWLTGFKNTLKGVGYFLGGALVQWSYYGALGFMLALVLVCVPWAALWLSADIGRTRRENINARTVFRKNHNITVLSAARLFLFASRDAWFEVPLPFFLRSAEGFGWERAAAAGMLGGWIILYGQVQSWTPQAVSKPLRQYPANKWHSGVWIGGLFFIPAVLAVVMQWSGVFRDGGRGAGIAALLVGLMLFAVVFAVSSSIHSFLVVKYSEGDKVAMNVGFYYMSNAAGRLIGTLSGGALYQWAGDGPVDGFAACFFLSACLTVVAAAITPFLHDEDGGLRCGPCLTCIAPPEENMDASDVVSAAAEFSEGECGYLRTPEPGCPTNFGSLRRLRSDFNLAISSSKLKSLNLFRLRL